MHLRGISCPTAEIGPFPSAMLLHRLLNLHMADADRPMCQFEAATMVSMEVDDMGRTHTLASLGLQSSGNLQRQEARTWWLEVGHDDQDNTRRNHRILIAPSIYSMQTVESDHFDVILPN